MASFRIKFPEKDEPTVIVLTGPKITVGRLPHNTIQIVDRVISGNHAELIQEGDGHYRLRDLGSTNGTFVNGQFVVDYHLREACTVAFGTVECAFNPETPADTGAGDIEALPTRAEVAGLKRENEDLKAQVAALKEELSALHQLRPMTPEEAALGVPKAEYERVTADRELLKEAQQKHQQEIARLKENLALLRRDRENLQRAWEITKAELSVYRPPAPGAANREPGTAAPASETTVIATPEPTQKVILKPVPIAKPPMARPPGAPPPQLATAAPKAAARGPFSISHPAKGTQKMTPETATATAPVATSTPAPKVLPKPTSTLGAAVPVPKVDSAPAFPPAENENPPG